MTALVRARLLASLVIGVVVAVGVPGVAAAQPSATNPLAPGLPSTPPTTPAQTTPTPTITAPSTTSTSGGGLGGGSVVAIAIGAIVLLGGISLFIWRDARRRAPVRHRAALAAGDGSRSGSKARGKPRRLSPAERRRRKRGRAR